MTEELKTRPEDQPLPVAGLMDVGHAAQLHIRYYGSVNRYPPTLYETIVADDEARIQLGVKRYGRRLQTCNGRDVLLDLYEELLDALHYSTQYRLEHQDDGKSGLRAALILDLVFDTKQAILERDKAT